MSQLDFWKPNFLDNAQVFKIEKNFWSPVYVYSENELEKSAKDFLAFPSAFWCNTRYAMKANSNINILKIFKNLGLKIDASSEYEVYRAMNAWFAPEDISISAQEFPTMAEDLIKKGVFINTTSLHQIEKIGKVVMKFWLDNYNIWVRINPGTWDWAFKAISTWGTTSGFWIWHEKISEIKELSKKYNLKIIKIHIHIGSENTPESWVNSANIWLSFVETFEDVVSLDLGWGFKKAIMPYEKSADLQAIWEAVKEKFEEFYNKTWRKIALEVEPWKSLVINSASVIAKVVDIVDTWENWYKFIRTNSWMTEMPRVPMYWVQEPIYVVKNLPIPVFSQKGERSNEKEDYVVIGHCCESGDLLTCKLYEQETIEPRNLDKVEIWDLLVIDWVWAYNSSMSMKNYNSFPEAGEVMIMKDWTIKEIRKREKLEEIWRNEIDIIN